jgi:hypothetical protein
VFILFSQTHQVVWKPSGYARGETQYHDGQDHQPNKRYYAPHDVTQGDIRRNVLDDEDIQPLSLPQTQNG